jgi:hypothetical protein
MSMLRSAVISTHEPGCALVPTLHAYRSLRVMSADVPAPLSFMVPPVLDSTIMLVPFLKVCSTSMRSMRL